MAFTTVCPACGNTLRLLNKLLDHKIMCPDCRKPFIALAADRDAVGVEDGSGPNRGWLIVCPGCGRTEAVADGGQRPSHCPTCGTAFAAPVTESKPIRRRRH